MPQHQVFLDTSFMLALENRDDPFHERAKQVDRDLISQECILLLHWGILLEIGDGYARVDRREKGLELLEKFRREEGYQIVPLTESLVAQAISLFQQRSDKSWGLTDCISFALMQREGVSEALTADVHFRQAGFKAVLLD